MHDTLMSMRLILHKPRQDAMTSEQVLLLTATALLAGCELFSGPGAKPLHSPYPTHRVWAVAPLRNESGSVQANGWSMADHLAEHLENATGLDVVPVNRVLAAMEKLEIDQISSPTVARQLLHSLAVDGLVVGSITAYDPYDPPKLGLAVELYVDQRVEFQDAMDVRQLARASTDVGTLPTQFADLLQPTSTASAIFNAADAKVGEKLRRYAKGRGQSPNQETWHLYRINMDLYSEFVSYVISWRLLRAEAQRLMPPAEEKPAHP